MRLGDLVSDGGDPAVTGFALDHRKVAPGTVFGAFRGARVNGEDFIPQAIASGAIAVVTRPGVPVEGALCIAADEPRAVFARLAARFFAPFPATTVTSGQVFLLGDARDAAVDSRLIGTQPLAEVLGVAVARLTPAGMQEPLPGSPARARPDGRAVVDPADPVPPAGNVETTG